MDVKGWAAIIAIVISIISLVITLLQKSAETNRVIRSQLTDVITDLDSLFDEENKLTTESEGNSNPSYLLDRRSYLNGRKRFLAYQAIFLINENPKVVYDFEYNAVADAFRDIGEYSEANKYYEEAITRSKRPYYRSIIQRALANNLFEQGNFEDSRKYYGRSINEVPLDSDLHIYHTAETYQRWACQEAGRSFQKEAAELFEKAKSTYEKMEDPRQIKKALSNLEYIRAKNPDV